MIDDFYQSLLDDKHVETFRITIYTIMYEGSCKSGLVITLNRLEYAIEKNHFLIRKTKSRKELFSFGISTCTFLNRTAYVSEQRKQQNKQHGFEICYTELLYLFVYSNKILISGLKKQQQILVGIIFQLLLYNCPPYIFLLFVFNVLFYSC